VTRLIALIVGLVAAAAALYTLGLGGGDVSAVSGPPLDEIDAASRAQLERVLREAEHSTGAPDPHGAD
jgi:hypothetical protein